MQALLSVDTYKKGGLETKMRDDFLEHTLNQHWQVSEPMVLPYSRHPLPQRALERHRCHCTEHMHPNSLTKAGHIKSNRHSQERVDACRCQHAELIQI